MSLKANKPLKKVVLPFLPHTSKRMIILVIIMTLGILTIFQGDINVIIPVTAQPSIDSTWQYENLYSPYPSPLTILTMDSSADGKYIVIGDEYAGVSMINASGYPVWINSPFGSSPNRFKIAISSDGNYIAALKDEYFFFLDNTGTELWGYQIGGVAMDLDISADGSYVTVCNETDVILFNRTHGLMWSYHTNVDHLRSVAMSADGFYIVAAGTSGSDANDIHLFNRTDKLMWTYPCININAWVHSVDISADGNYIAAGVNGRTIPSLNRVFLLNRTTQQLIWSETHPYIGYDNIAISDDGNCIVSAIASTGDFSVFNQTGFLWNETLTVGGDLDSIAMSLDGTNITLGYAGAMYSFSKNGSILWGCGGTTGAVTISDNGKHVAAIADTDLYFFDFQAPSIDTPSDNIYELATTGNTITWHPSDYTPSHYNITRNGILVENGSWNGGDIVHDIVELYLGTYDFVCSVNDTEGNNATSGTTVVTIEDTTNPSIDQPSDITYEAGMTGYTITWTPLDADPTDYSVTNLSILVVSDEWDGSPITVNVDGLVGGITYIFNCIVEDNSGNINNDVVFVFVEIEAAPTIDAPNDVSYEEGTTGSSITWHPDDLSPDTYTITRNGTSLGTVPWNGNDITVPVDGLSPGTYIYNCMVEDALGNSVNNTVIVTVTAQPSSDNGTTTSSSTGELSSFPSVIFILGFVGTLVIIKKKLRRS